MSRKPRFFSNFLTIDLNNLKICTDWNGNNCPECSKISATPSRYNIITLQVPSRLQSLKTRKPAIQQVSLEHDKFLLLIALLFWLFFSGFIISRIALALVVMTSVLHAIMLPFLLCFRSFFVLFFSCFILIGSIFVMIVFHLESFYSLRVQIACPLPPHIRSEGGRVMACREIVRVLKPGGTALISGFMHTGEYEREFRKPGLATGRSFSFLGPLVLHFIVKARKARGPGAKIKI